MPINPATQRALASEGKVWTPRAPHAVHPEDDAVVDPAQAVAGDKEHSASVRPRKSSHEGHSSPIRLRKSPHARAKIIRARSPIPMRWEITTPIPILTSCQIPTRPRTLGLPRRGALASRFHIGASSVIWGNSCMCYLRITNAKVDFGFLEPFARTPARGCSFNT